MNEYIKKEEAEAIITKYMVKMWNEIEQSSITEERRLFKYGDKWVTEEEHENLCRGTFGGNLKSICKDNGITLIEVSDGTGISQNTIYNITKRGTKKPRGDLATKVFNYLKTRIPELTMEELCPTMDNGEEDNKSKINIGANIRAIREAKGITQAELGKMANCGTQANIGQIERRQGGVTTNTLIKIADALDVTVADLVKEAEQC